MYRLSAEGNGESVAQNGEMVERKCEVKKRCRNVSLMAKYVQEINMTSSWKSNSIIYKIVHKSE